MLSVAIGKYDEGYRYGQLSLELLQKYSIKEYVPRVFAAVYGKSSGSAPTRPEERNFMLTPLLIHFGIYQGASMHGDVPLERH
jgi:predicted ATPase